MKSKCINIVIYFKTSNFVFSLYCASLLHTDRQYILSVCCLFINLKGTSKPTSFQTTVFKVEDFLERLKASQFSFQCGIYSTGCWFWCICTLYFNAPFLSFHLCFLFVCLSRFCRTHVRVYYVQRLKIQSTNRCEKKCLWWQFRSRECCRLKSVLLDLCCTYCSPAH